MYPTSFIARKALLPVLTLVLAVAAPAASLSAATVELVSIQCVKTQESGGDTVRLEVKKDNKNPTRIFTRKMRRNETWNVNQKFDFTTILDVRLREKDPIFNDDLGRVQIKFNASAGTRTYNAKLGGGHYILTYRVTSKATYALKLLSIKAVKTQEGTDELRVKYKADAGSALAFAKRPMKTGQIWALNKEIPFNARAEARLTDQDLIWDDNFGGISVTSAMVGGVRVQPLNQGGARYEIRYQVVKK